MLRIGISKREIAKALGVALCTVYFEIQRGQCEQLTTDYQTKRKYLADVAHKRYLALRQERTLKIGHDHALVREIERCILQKKLSPYASLQHIEQERHTKPFCLRTLYSYIARRDVFLHLAPRHLPYAKHKRGRKEAKLQSRASAGQSIEKRPADVQTRQTFGHWEMDSVVSGQGGTGALLVLTERKTRFGLVCPVADHTAKSATHVLDMLERRFGKLFARVFQSITVDNGNEFADAKGLARSIDGKHQRTQIFYCHAYSRTNEEATKI